MKKSIMGKVTGLGLLVIGLALAVPAGAQMGDMKETPAGKKG